MINEVLLNILKKEPNVLSYLPRRIRNDYKFMLKAIEINNRCGKYASEELRNNPNFILETIKIDYGYSCMYASEGLKNDPNFMLEAIKINPSCCMSASVKLRNSPEFVLEAIKISSGKLCISSIASERLKGDSHFVLEALKMTGDVLNIFYASEGLKNDPNFMLEAIKINHGCFSIASNDLKNDPNFMLEACKIDLFFYLAASKELKEDSTFNSRIKENVPMAYYCVNLKSSNNFMNYGEYIEKYKKELRANPQLIYQIPNAFYNDLDFMMDVAKINPDIFMLAPTSLQDNIHFVTRCENTKINQIKVSRVNRTGELSMQDKMLDAIEDCKIQLMDEKRKNLIIKSQIINMQNNYAQPSEEMGGISHGQR